MAEGITVSATIFEDAGFPSAGAVVQSDTVAVTADGPVTFAFAGGALVKGAAYVFHFSVDVGLVQLIVDGGPYWLAPNYWGESPDFSIVGQVNVSGTDADSPTATATGSLTPSEPDGSNGWYVTNPTLLFDCSDATTVVTDCPVGGII